jgi:hypothetical protein
MILLVSDGIFHPPLPGRLALGRFMRSLDGFRFQRVSRKGSWAESERFAAPVLRHHNPYPRSVIRIRTLCA